MLRKERQATQERTAESPLLPTTTIGSFPQTKEVKQNRTKFEKAKSAKKNTGNNAKGFIRDCIALQENIGLDVLVHGEFERNDMVEFLAKICLVMCLP